MIEELKIIDEGLNKLDTIDRNKFRISSFNELNNHFKTLLDNFESVVINNKKKPSNDQEILLLKNMIAKIDKLESRILQKSELISSFSKSII